MLQRVIVVVLSLPFAIILSAYLLPDSTEVSRSIVIERPAADVFPYLNNLESMQTWSPWAKKDPNMQVVYPASKEGVGAVMQWRSDKPDVGKGQQEIIESDQDQHVALSFAFENQSPAKVLFDLEALAENRSQLTWTFVSEHGSNPMNRYMGLLFDGMLGPDFETGLADLKNLLEQQPINNTDDELEENSMAEETANELITSEEIKNEAMEAEQAAE